MRTSLACALLALGCAAPRTEAPPPSPGASERVRRAIDTLLQAKSVKTKFESRLAPAAGDPLVIAGEAVSVAGGVAFVRYRASGGDVKRIVAVGDRAWVYHELSQEWVTAAELGMSGAGRGVQDVRGVLATLAAHADNARQAADAVVVSFAGRPLAAIMREHATDQVVWENSAMDVRIEGSISRIRATADLVTTERTSLEYQADLTIESVDRDFVLRFDVPLASHVREAIEKRPGIPREVIDSLRR